MKKLLRSLCMAVLAVVLLCHPSQGQERVKKVVFQAFWWDYWNENFRFSWANYLTELAPRLKAAGFNAVWIPPAYKNENPDFVGYMPFDNYDLGDKRQKGNGHPLNDRLRTRVGTKDDLLRMIAVMHANGIEVIHDIVLNHNGGAGGGVQTHGASGPAGQAGAGGQDPISPSMANANGFKNFRYVSYATPAIDETAVDYWSRSGRWAKNWQNFYNCTSGCNDINSMFWGPDINYDLTAFGQSSNIPATGNATFSGGISRPYHNPVQTNGYMLNNARNWLVWMKKQTGADGWRWDAVKHFPLSVQEDLIYNTKYNAGFANGGQNMLNIGEWVGSAADLDAYVFNVRHGSAPGGVSNEISTGTFDFGLRGFNSGNQGLFTMITGNGGYNMQNIPGQQQSNRVMTYPDGKRVHRTVPFINNHDTYRPIVSANGNFAQPLGVSSGWNNSSQLATNVDPREPRLAAAYAVIFAVDGNPQVFFEDLYNVWGTGKRYSHLPTSLTDLPHNADIINIMQAHQRLNFKDGDYGVPTAANSPFYQQGNSGDHIVFERAGRALIGVTDAFNGTATNSADQQVFIRVSDAWPVGTVLYDYSGAHGITSVTVPADRRVLIATAPVGHTIPNAFGHGYSIWAPAPPGVTVTSVNDLYNYLGTYDQPLARTTTQEWEMANDLGDSHCESLGQGGSLPANSTNQRVAGKIFVEAGQPINYRITPETDGTQVVASLWNLDGNMLHSISGTSTTANPLSGSFTPNFTGWVTIKVRQGVNTQNIQRAWVNVTYKAPATVDTRNTANAVTTRAAIWTGNKGTTDVTDCGNWEEGRLPDATRNLVVPAYSSPMPIITGNVIAKDVILESGASVNITSAGTLRIRGNVLSNGSITGSGRIIFEGTTTQTFANNNGTNASSFTGEVEINNAQNVELSSSLSITGTLRFTTGRLVVNGSANVLNLNASTLIGISATNYIQLSNSTSNAPSVQRNVTAGTPELIPVGNTNYTPITVTPNATGVVSVSATEQVLSSGFNGSAMSATNRVNKMWNLSGSGGTTTATVVFQWNAADENATLLRNSLFVASNANGSGTEWQQATTTTTASGSNPFTVSAANISLNASYAVFSTNGALPVQLTNFAASLRGDKQVQLRWDVASETNTKGYEIERSFDGSNFTTVGFVAASQKATYFFSDAMQKAKQFYRLKMIDNDGTYAYSKTAIVQFTLTGKQISIVPNPVVNQVNLISNGFDAATEVSIEVVNMHGARISTFKGSLQQAQQSLSNVLVQQPAGMYLFKINVGEQQQSIRVLKQ